LLNISPFSDRTEFPKIFSIAYKKHFFRQGTNQIERTDDPAQMSCILASLPQAAGQEAIQFGDLSFLVPNPQVYEQVRDGEPPVRMRDEITSLPDVLCIKLGLEATGLKSKQRIMIPSVITYETLLQHQTDLAICKEEYKVAAVICHLGEEVASGHYICYSQRTVNKSVFWFLIDDNVTVKVSNAEFEGVLNGAHKHNAQPFLIIYEKRALREKVSGQMEVLEVGGEPAGNNDHDNGDDSAEE
jgi:hypothetical protein